MKCFYDPSQDAVGLCRSCLRAVSQEHLVDLGKGLACKGRCETDVSKIIMSMETYHQSIESNRRSTAKLENALKVQTKVGYGNSVLACVLGAMFVIAGKASSEIAFMFYLGLALFVYGTWRAMWITAYRKAAASD